LFGPLLCKLAQSMPPRSLIHNLRTSSAPSIGQCPGCTDVRPARPKLARLKRRHFSVLLTPHNDVGGAYHPAQHDRDGSPTQARSPINITIDRHLTSHQKVPLTAPSVIVSWEDIGDIHRHSETGFWNGLQPYSHTPGFTPFSQLVVPSPLQRAQSLKD